MPTSTYKTLAEIIELIIFIDPDSLLDVGVGFGKYGVLSREYLELWSRSEAYNNWKIRIDGIEVFKEYITPLHNFIYNNIYIGDALEIIPNLKQTYDLILLIDVLEHFDYHNGMKLLDLCKKSSKSVIVSTPAIFFEQKSSFGNIYETHKFLWERKHFSQIDNKIFIKNKDALIVCISSDINKIRSFYDDKIRQAIKNTLKHLFFFLVPPYHFIKKLF